ncbi:T9SS type A sorting domain-containing protein [Fulvivirga sp. M361]|uniref:T9SS type A sorting domain-containing protein n=1 Tax=Fulvivirga sp. M361 TaxID=2594266 RepID=UPI00117BCC36|nr:T9SS type A sorting domain-containing protein [Fulvivirga sp. M361]TRX47186.1 T9SS type A sorting domain-containing protein [Fulvivirga sp. M361]
MKNILIVTALMIVSLTSANANVNSLTQPTSVEHFQAEAREKTITLTWEITGTDSTEEVVINITNLEGTVVYESTAKGYSSTLSLDGKVKAGVYMAQISVGNVQKTKRVVIR